jgi:ABC-type Mn2+/Zn2+ transport system ATPase subunit
MLLSVGNLTVYYGQTVALNEINFEAHTSEVIGIIGPNGSGKTTLFNALLALCPYAGEMQLDGKKLSTQLSRTSYMPQVGQIDISFPVTVYDVIKLGLASKRSIQSLTTVLKRLKLEELREKNLTELSGGQLQRVFLARALARGGDVVLLDEPTNHVDAPSEQVIADVIQDLRKENKIILLSTHSIEFASRVCSKLLLLRNKVVAFGTVKEVCTPELLAETFGTEVVFNLAKGGYVITEEHHDC